VKVTVNKGIQLTRAERLLLPGYQAKFDNRRVRVAELADGSGVFFWFRRLGKEGEGLVVDTRFVLSREAVDLVERMLLQIQLDRMERAEKEAEDAACK